MGDPRNSCLSFYTDTVSVSQNHYDCEFVNSNCSTFPVVYTMVLNGTIIPAWATEDEGSYKVTAKNKLGESNANINLNLEGMYALFVFIIECVCVRNGQGSGSVEVFFTNNLMGYP